MQPDIFEPLMARVRHYLETDMPFDEQHPTPRPERPRIDPDLAIAAVQKRLERPVTRNEYQMIWNATCRFNREPERRIDYWVDV